jgi:hypothetical protein
VRAAPLDVAEAAREAGTSFLVGVRNGWGKAQLASWLVGPYAHATSFTTEEQRIADEPVDSSPVTVPPESLDDVIFRARQEIVESLDATVYGRTKPAFVESAITLGSVTPFVWMPGVRGWAPRDRARLRLRDRVLALFAADYLTRPETYARELYVCPDCMCAVFDENAVSRGKCPLHDRPSGIRHPPKTLDERVDELLAASADDPAADDGFDMPVAPGSYRFVAGEPYTSIDFGADPKPSEPVILLKRRIKTA